MDNASILASATKVPPTPPMEIKGMIFVGRPDSELPHKDFSGVKRYFENNPKMRLVVVVRSQKDAEEVMQGVTATALPGDAQFTIVVWGAREALMDSLAKLALELVGFQIFGPAWYTCKQGHVTPRKKEGTTACDTCGATELEHVAPNSKEVEEFAEIFGTIYSLINFDTRSGKLLHQLVNPMTNVLKNMAYALPREGPPPVDLKEIWQKGKGKPAYLCAAGPSMDDAIPHLKRLQDTGVVLCVGRLYKHLRKHGIRVDFTISCEMFDWDSAIFDDVGDVGDTILLFPPVCANATVKKWPGRKYCMLDMQIAQLLGREEYTLGGNSVAHHQLNFAAEILQAEPLVLIGQDLAYTKPTLHTHSGEQPANWPKEIKDMDTEMQREHWGECTGKGDVFYPECHTQNSWMDTGVPPVAVGPIYVRSSPGYRDFGTLFSILIKRHGLKVVNSCPNGLKIEGTEYVDLASFDPKAVTLPPSPPQEPSVEKPTAAPVA